MGLFDTLFSVNAREKELLEENRRLREQLQKQTKTPAKTSATKSNKKVLYQCRYCSYKSVRNATDGAPLPGVNNCPRHPKGVHKGPHSWMRTYL